MDGLAAVRYSVHNSRVDCTGRVWPFADRCDGASDVMGPLRRPSASTFRSRTLSTASPRREWGRHRCSDHGRRRLDGLAVVARGAEPLADGTGVGLRRLGLGPARAGDPLSVTDEATDERFYERFKWSVIAQIEADRSMLDATDILGWVEAAALAVAER